MPRIRRKRIVFVLLLVNIMFMINYVTNKFKDGRTLTFPGAATKRPRHATVLFVTERRWTNPHQHSDNHERNLREFLHHLEQERTSMLHSREYHSPHPIIHERPETILDDTNFIKMSPPVPWMRSVALYLPPRLLQRNTHRPVGNISSIMWRRDPLYPFTVKEHLCYHARQYIYALLREKSGQFCAHHSLNQSNINNTADNGRIDSFRNSNEYRDYFDDLSRTFVRLIPNGVVLNNGHGMDGLVVARDFMFKPSMCPWLKDLLARVPQNLTTRHTYEEVFVMSSIYGSHYYHYNIEAMPRLVPYIQFLKDHPSIKIHVDIPQKKRGGYPSQYTRLFEIVGLNHSRIVTGDIQAKIVYLPQGGMCIQTFNPLNIQILSNLYLEYAEKNLEKSDKQTLILIHRVFSRQLSEHDEVAVFLNQTARNLNLEFVIFSDRKPGPTFDEMIRVFNRAALVVAPHGAGLVNLMWTPPPATVVEVLCADRIISCFLHLSQTLGHRHYAIDALKGCNNGLYANVTELKQLVNSIVSSGSV